MIPVPDEYLNIMKRYKKVVVVEENMNNQFSELIYGRMKPSGHCFVGSVGSMITPDMIINKILE
jgi:pyruvate/2-oxoacid:ferredoxin oxidoreductase alpha subunit